MTPQSRILLSLTSTAAFLLVNLFLFGCSQNNSETAFLIPVDDSNTMAETVVNPSPQEESVIVTAPTPQLTPTTVPIPTETPTPTLNIGYEGYTGERPTGLVKSKCTPLTIYNKDVEGVREHIDRYDAMCRSAEEDGIIFEVRSAFRNYYDQLDYYTSERFGPSVALHPDESMHVAGMAIDLTANSKNWTHEIVGCYDEVTNNFSYLVEPLPHLTYATKVRNGEISTLCQQSPSIIPIKRSMLFGLTPGCTVLTEPEWWGDPEVIECSSATLKANGMIREDWHFENADLISAFLDE